MTKETIYIEADDEITSVIDKVTSSKKKIVAVVLPKRATVFQSVVNMKLLKKASADAKKNLVLISSETAIKSIAAVAGVHIAKTLNSKPVVPKKPKAQSAETITTEELEEESSDDSESEIDKKPIVAAGAAATTAAAVLSDTEAANSMPNKSENEESIEIDNTDEGLSKSTKDGDLNNKKDDKKSKKDKKKTLKIPDFSSFKLRMALVIGVIVFLIVGWVFAFVILPKATITLNTDTSRIDVSTEFVAVVGEEELNVDEGLVPAQKAEVNKENSVTVPATGEQDKGEKASGIVTLTNCNKNSVTVSAGTGFSSSGKTFVSSEAVTLGPGLFIGNECVSGDFPNVGQYVKDVDVIAAEPGESYNVNAGSFSSSISGVSAYGSKMTGGTTNLVKVVSSEDVKSANDQLAGTDSAEAVNELKSQLGDLELQALEETLQVSEQTTTPSAAEGDEAEELTVKGSTTYIMLGVKSEDLSEILNKKLAEELGDIQDKNIRSNGLDKAVYTLINKTSDDNQTLSMKTVSTIGPEFNEEEIKKEVAGQKRGDIEKMLESRDGVRSVSVEYSPMWVFSTPSDPDKITIVINESEN